jgi:spore germination protein YaaH
LLAAVLAPQASARTPPRTASRPAGVQAFLLTGAPDSFADLRAHASQVSVVYPTYYECAPSGGRITGADDPAVDHFARAHAIRVLPRFTCQEEGAVERLLSEPRLRARTLARLAQIARSRSFAGLCLDLENGGAGQREALSSFVAALAHALHAEHKHLTVVVDGVADEAPAGSSEAFYDDSAIAAAADTVFVLAWGSHWEDSAPGPLAPLSYVQGVARYLRSLPGRAHFVLGAPMYGLDWGVAGAGAGALQYSGITGLEQRVGAHAAREAASGEMTFRYTAASGVAHSVWYMDARAVLDVIAIARANGLGAGLWRLGEEDQALWSSPLVGRAPKR